MTVVLIVIIALLVLLVLYGIVTYNRLIRLRTQSEEGFSDIDVQLKRRHDLIPNLVETVKGYASHERQTFENVTAARGRAVAATGPEAQAQAENALTGALRQLFAVAEQYPDLKASQNFIELQDELTDTEDKIQASRRFYNMTVRDLNIKIQSFPARVIAGMGDFRRREFFELEQPADREVPAVSFGTASASGPGPAA
jgi:LemA protein